MSRYPLLRYAKPLSDEGGIGNSAMRKAFPWVIVAFAILFALFVWPTRYHDEHDKGTLVRIDRFTGRIDVDTGAILSGR